MRELTGPEVDHVAHLARLEITLAERESFGRQLGEILTYVEQLSTVDTEGVEPLLAVFARHDVLREDVSRPALGPDQVLRNAPEQEAGQFRIPRILEES